MKRVAVPSSLKKAIPRGRKNVGKILALFKEGMGHQAQGRADVAMGIYDKILQMEPANTDALYLKSQIYFESREYSKALHFLGRCGRSKSENAELNYIVAYNYFQMERFDKAVRHLQKALEIQPDYTIARLLMAKIYAKSGQRDLGRKLLTANGSVRPNGPEESMTYANVLSALGLLDQAKHLLLDLLDKGHLASECLYELAKLPARLRNPGFPSKVATFLENSDLAIEDRIRCCFAAGLTADHEKRFDAAFAYFAEANGLSAANFNIVRYKKTVNGLINAFSCKMDAPTKKAVNLGPTPLYIFGMPRAGKSLVEQALADHPAVATAGEITLRHFIDEDIFVGIDGRLPDDFQAKLSNLTLHECKKYAQGYLREIAKNIPYSENIQFVTNTLPHNFQNLGVIRRIFPYAKLIHVRRNPLDTGLFCFMKSFRNEHLYTNNLEVFGAYYRCYEKLMAHWKTVLGSQLFEVDYESFVARPEEVTRSILAFLGLDDENGVPAADFLPESPAITGPSDVAITQTYDGYWRNYEKHLAPLQSALGRGMSVDSALE